MAKTFLVNFGATVYVDGCIQVKANSQEEAEQLAEQLANEYLNQEDCIVEIGDDINNVTIKNMELPQRISAVDIHNSMSLD